MSEFTKPEIWILETLKFHLIYQDWKFPEIQTCSIKDLLCLFKDNVQFINSDTRILVYMPDTVLWSQLMKLNSINT